MNLEKAIWGANYLHCDVRSCVVNAHTFGPYCQGWQGSVLIAYLQVKSVILRIRQAMRDRSGPANDAFLLAAGMEKGGGRDRPSRTLRPFCHPRSLGRA